MVEPVFCYCRIVVILEQNLPVMFFQSDLNSAVGLSNINLKALAGRRHISGPGVFSPRSSLHRTEEHGDHLVRQAINFDVAFIQLSINATVCRLDMWQHFCFAYG